MLKKNKDLPMDQYIEEIRKFSLQNNKDYFKDCKDVPDGDPCVFLRLDNGMFWHSTATEYCEITQVEMNNCGAASEKGSILYNLMSTSEGGSQRYHVTLEYNEGKNQVVQVLGQANTLPKEKYWPSITEFFNAMNDPELNKDAFEHLYGEEEEDESLDKRIEAFIQGIGARTKPKAAVESWEAMKQQIRDGYYSEKFETTAAINGRQNFFKASLSYTGMTGPVDKPSSRAVVMLSIRGILQTKGTDEAEEWRKTNPNIFRKARELGESQEFKKILYEAIPEILTRPSRFDIKYSNISTARLRVGGMGDYKMSMQVPFKIDVRGWSSAKGESLAYRFDKLLQITLRDLPAQAMMTVLALEGKFDVNEGKEKMKLDRNYLTSLITEVMEEEREFDFSRLIDKDLDYEYLQTMIEMQLNAEEIKYGTYNYPGKYKKVAYIFEQQPYEDGGYYWYQPFNALIDAFEKAGIPNQSKTMLKNQITSPSYRVTQDRGSKRVVEIYDNS